MSHAMRFIETVPALAGGEPHEPIDEPLVTVWTYDDPLLAHVDRVILEHEGLLPVIADANIVAMDWLYANAIGGVKLQVPRSQSVRATEILRSGKPAPNADDTDGIICQRCGSHDVYRVKAWKKTIFGLMLGVMLLGTWFLAPLFGHRLQCESCQREWKP